MKAPVISEAEYDALPQSIQRKCFSSVERLRIAEQSVLSCTTRTSTSRLSPPLRLNPRNGARETTSKSLQRDGARPRRRLKKPRDPPTNTGITKEEAEWFLSLPDKVWKRHFTREEQVLLTEWCELLLSDILYKAGHSPDRSGATCVPDRYSTLDGLAFEDERSDCGSTLSSTADSDAEMDVFRSYTQRRRSVAAVGNSRPPPPPRSTSHSQRSSFRRTFSFSASHPLPHAQSSSVPPLPSSSLSQNYSRPSVGVLTHQVNSPSPQALDSSVETKHYQDPEARLKLRLYLATPQKFDEALEFGFPKTEPTTQPPSTVHPQRAASQQKSGSDQHIHLDTAQDSWSSFYSRSEDGEDSSSLPDTDSPITPTADTSSAFPLPTITRSTSSSLDSGLGRPPLALRDKSNDRFAPAVLANREMTLRMTLTRPDLRAPEEQLYGWQNNRPGSDRAGEAERSDPLALSELKPSDDVDGTHGVFAMGGRQGNGFRRLWRSLRSRRV
ncbi:hypothetical protein LTR28_006647 [Elasticomyces elasticus]|nr:hypothetical protein LTR28_006647 [Elasticomyces elasticus]